MSLDYPAVQSQGRALAPPSRDKDGFHTRKRKGRTSPRKSTACYYIVVIRYGWKLAKSGLRRYHIRIWKFRQQPSLNTGLSGAGDAVFGIVAAAPDDAAAIAAAPALPYQGFSACAPAPDLRITSTVQTQQ
jgi:hypothetical protein